MKIPFAPMYDVTESGVVTNSRGKVIKPYLHHSGYMLINLNVGDKRITTTMHKIMAETFIPKPNSGTDLTVNHKDKDKTNYSLSNLEWLSNADNVTHGQGKRVEQVLDGKVIATYNSSQEAARALGRPNSGSCIRSVCRNEPGKASYAGYEWRYV